MEPLEGKWRPLPPDGALTEEEARKIRAHLGTLLRSSAFRNSPRCQEFLSHTVELALSGRRDQLKERLIGVQLFGRQTAYDTAEDPIVRVKANEVRKRLAQAYEELGATEGVRIVLPPGTYVPQFHLAEPAEPATLPQTVAAPARRIAAWSRAHRLAALGCGLLAAALALLSFWPRPGALQQFWQPLLAAESPLLVSLGASELLRVSPAAAKIVAATPPGREVTLPASDISLVRNEFISLAHFRGLVEISQFCQRHQKRIDFRPGLELSADELRLAPILFVGAFSNEWTIREHAELRFRFERLRPGLAIVDTQTPGRSWSVPEENPKTPRLDYALITRLQPTSRQGPRLFAAGLTRFGTQAALDFLSQPGYWNDVARQLPRGWPQRNVQIVLRVNIVAGSHQPASVLASHVW
ncbi:MAG: hypothetical protein N2036_05735 [Bryobacteraceae bacterium]|nr:hypothetical protein [Bryobacteraceae bacterium]